MGVLRRILVFRALQVGDMLCAVPALRALRLAFPTTHITLAGLPWASHFVRRFACYIDEFIAFPGHPQLPEQPADVQRYENFLASVSAMDFDLVLQMHGSGEISNAIVARCNARFFAGFVRDAQREAGSAVSGLTRSAFLPYPDHGHEAERLLTLARFVGAASNDASLEFPITSEDLHELALREPWCESGTGKPHSLKPHRYVCIHPGARDRAKCWPAEHFARVADCLSAETGLDVVLTGSAAEHDLAEAVIARMHRPAINAACDISLGALAALLRDARLLVCNDTGVSHIAEALRLPSVVIFRRADMARWAPANRQLHSVVFDPTGSNIYTVIESTRAVLNDVIPRETLHSVVPRPD